MDLYWFHYFNSLNYSSTILSHFFLQKIVKGVSYRKKKQTKIKKFWIFLTSKKHAYTVKKFSETFPKIVGQLKIQMGRNFFQRYSRKYFRHRTGNSYYCLFGEISSILGNIYLFHNLCGKRSKKSEQISVFVE